MTQSKASAKMTKDLMRAIEECNEWAKHRNIQGNPYFVTPSGNLKDFDVLHNNWKMFYYEFDNYPALEKISYKIQRKDDLTCQFTEMLEWFEKEEKSRGKSG